MVRRKKVRGWGTVEDKERNEWPGKKERIEEVRCGVVGPMNTRHTLKEEAAGRSSPGGIPSFSYP
jgi:hypothetical protein